MTGRKISELPETPARAVALEAQQKGRDVVFTPKPEIWDMGDLHFLGLCQIIYELREEIRVLKGGLK